MTADFVVLSSRAFDASTLTEALLAAGPDLRVASVADGAALQLFTDDGQPVTTLESPTLVQVPGEATRLLGVAPEPPVPYWWTELRAPTTRSAAAARLADALARLLGGTVHRAGAEPERVAPSAGSDTAGGDDRVGDEAGQHPDQ